MGKLSKAELDALVEEATVDAYDEEEQLSGFHIMLAEHLALPFRTTVLGVEVTVKKIDRLAGSGIVAICVHGAYWQAIGILDLPLPAPPPEGSEWIDAYRHWGPDDDRVSVRRVPGTGSSFEHPSVGRGWT